MVNRKPLTKTHTGKEESERAGRSHLKVSNLLEKRLGVTTFTLLKLLVGRESGCGYRRMTSRESRRRAAGNSFN